ncbi:flagellar basal body P-ring formation chaperone FlgA [Novosphingobium sp.]|uniref:flagellar basal body P-ring formation chaperone FlgA n=1 Tax=Novosphingobium sp. TaxID=1874826 RepID=UPI003D1299FE
MKFSLSLCIAGLLAQAPHAHAQALAPGLHDPGAIDRAVASFTGQPIGAPGGAARPIDRRLRLGACAAPLALSWRGEAHASILVECPDAGGWHLFVALAAGARQTAAAPVIERGQSVTVALTGDGFSVTQSGEALENGAVDAWIRVRTVAKGEPLQARVVRPGLVEVPVE